MLVTHTKGINVGLPTLLSGCNRSQMPAMELFLREGKGFSLNKKSIM